jgi:predicted MFS family arabinose efflux permease
MDLLIIGGAGLVGLALRTRLYSLLIGIPLAMAALAIALIVLGRSPFAAGSLLALFDRHGGAGWLVDLDESKELPDDAEAGGGLLVAVVQLAIALGAAAGGWVFDASGYQATFSLSAGILFVAALLAFAAWLGVARPRLLTTEG